MEQQTIQMDMESLMALYRTLLPQVDTLPLVVSGTSMAPFLAPDRDRVFLSAVTRPLKAGDIVLYQRDCGTYVLHRIVRVDGDR